MIKLLRHLRDCTSGAALLEGAIVFPVVAVLMLGTIEIGRAVHIYHTADKSMRSAARYLARVPEQAACNGAWGQENARNLAVYGTVDPGEKPKPLIPGWEPHDVTISFKFRDPECAPPPPDDPLVLVLAGNVPVAVQMMVALGFSGTININVRHEERHIGG